MLFRSEIISYVIEGALEHKDSIGTGSVIRPGDVQRMSAGSGIRHSEFNASKTEPVHFLQVWILPQKHGIAPGYEQKAFSKTDKDGRLKLVGSHDGREGSVTIHNDVDLYASNVRADDKLVHTIRPGRIAWLQVAHGNARLNGELIMAGDGASVSEAGSLEIRGVADGAEVLLFDMAA